MLNILANPPVDQCLVQSMAPMMLTIIVAGTVNTHERKNKTPTSLDKGSLTLYEIRIIPSVMAVQVPGARSSICFRLFILLIAERLSCANRRGGVSVETGGEVGVTERMDDTSAPAVGTNALFALVLTVYLVIVLLGPVVVP